MSKVAKQLLCLSALAFLALAMGAQAALAGDADVSDTTGFGLSAITSPLTFSLVTSTWSASLTENVFLNNAGVYTYVFDITNSGTPPTVPLSLFTTATVGPPNVDNFSSLLNFGVVTGTTSVGVDDGTAGCTTGGFCFGTSSLTVQPTSSSVPGHLPPGMEFTFYVQSNSGPVPGAFTAIDGGISNFPPAPTLDPGPEPRSILLFGTGLLMFGVVLRRRLPQLQQPV